MSKQEADARREVGNKDLEIVDKVINSHEAFQTQLYVLRRILGEIGKLEELHRGLKQGVEHTQAQSGEQARAFEHAKAQLEAVQREEVEARKRVAELTAEIAAKEKTLNTYTRQIERITGAAA